MIVPSNLSATKGQSLTRYVKKAKLGHVTPHALRHSAAKPRRETGASIEDVGTLLGHQNIATTARYLARLEGTIDVAHGAPKEEICASSQLLDIQVAAVLAGGNGAQPFGCQWFIGWHISSFSFSATISTAAFRRCWPISLVWKFAA